MLCIFALCQRMSVCLCIRYKYGWPSNRHFVFTEAVEIAAQFGDVVAYFKTVAIFLNQGFTSLIFLKSILNYSTER